MRKTPLTATERFYVMKFLEKQRQVLLLEKLVQELEAKAENETKAYTLGRWKWWPFGRGNAVR